MNCKNLMEYKGYYGSLSLEEESLTLHGKLEFIQDLVTYEAPDAEGIVREFHNAVDDYLETCRSQGREPNEPLLGTFTVRIDPQLHRDAVLAASRQGMSLNRFVANALQRYIEKTSKGAW